VRERLRPEGIEAGDLDPQQFAAFMPPSLNAGRRSWGIRRHLDIRNRFMLTQEQNEQLTRTDRGL